MAKRKKRARSERRTVNKGAVYQIKLLLGWVVLLFLFAALFNKAGSLGGSIYTALAHYTGAATPGLAFFLGWVVLHRLMPDRIPLSIFPTFFGCLIFYGILLGFLHTLAVGDARELVQQGMGGGAIGYAVSSALSNLVGTLVARFVLIVFMVISLLLIFDFALPFLREPIDEEDRGEEESRVRVAGEISDEVKEKSKKGISIFKKRAVAPVVELPSKKPSLAMQRSANWNYPPITLFDHVEMKPQAGNIQKRMDTIKKTLQDFGIDVTMMDVNIGPTVTQYTLKPAEGVKLNQITARQDDLALALAAHSLRVEAPIPGKGLVGIEIPNEKKAMVGLRDIFDSKEFKGMDSKLALVLGRDAAGSPSVVDLSRMPHVLVAGSTGSGKSVCINSIILSLLVNNSPDELRMILVDPKRVELTGYNGLPHLLTPVITESKDTIAALAWAVREMDRRYKVCQTHGKRNIDQYNAEPDLAEGKLPYIIIIVDELADLMMVAAREVEGSIVRLAQMARAVGIHLIVATQRPSVDVITGLIKANVPTRIAFAVVSQIDSRTIIDQSGAEKLLGQGDMLYVSTDLGKPKRIQGVFAAEKEINAVIAHIKMQEEGDRYDPSVLETRVESRLGGSRDGGDIDDDLFKEAYEVVKQAGKASTTLLQTRLSVGYARAARLIQAMEDQGLVGPAKGSKPREVYGTDVGLDDGIAAYPEEE
jgi:DNA segregation ATPase FtsK/SpoIIIE, S-DNA-T family